MHDDLIDYGWKKEDERGGMRGKRMRGRDEREG